MADYYSQAVFQPSIPKHLINDEDRRIIEAFSITFESDGEDKFYLYAEEWCCNGYLDPEESGGEEIELSEDDLFSRFQEIIRRSNGELPWISKESAYTCSRMRPDGFGGGAVFITADDIQCSFTGQWLEERISETETGDIGTQKEDPPPSKPIVGFVLEGGLVQSIVSNVPEQLPEMDVIVLDYDVEGFEEECLLNVPQSSGEIAHAVGHIEKISESGIDLGMVLNQMNARGGDMSPLERTTDEPTNEERANRIDTVMQAYCLTLEGRDFDGDEDDVKDLLADLMHFCERMEIDFEENLRVARNNYEHERDAEHGGTNQPGCPLCGCFLEVTRTDTLLGIGREIFTCQNCDETFIRELTVADSPIERAVKCVGCGNMIPQSSARIFYQRDDYAHFIGECCWIERPTASIAGGNA